METTIKTTKGSELNGELKISRNTIFFTCEKGSFIIKVMDAIIKKMSGMNGNYIAENINNNIKFVVSSESEEVIKNMFEEIKEKKEEEKQKRIQEEKLIRDEILSGKRKIKCNYVEGCPLSGYMVEGYYESLIAEELEISVMISGWGLKVKDEIIEKYGIEFFVTEIIKEKKEEEKELDNIRKEEEKELQNKRKEAFEKAKETNENIFVRTVGMYDGDEEYPGKEMGIVYINEYITPKGEIIKKEIATN